MKDDGAEVLAHLRASRRCYQTRVIVASTAEFNQPLLAELGVDAYFRKPSSFDEFLSLGSIIKGLFT